MRAKLYFEEPLFTCLETNSRFLIFFLPLPLGERGNIAEKDEGLEASFHLIFEKQEGTRACII